MNINCIFFGIGIQAERTQRDLMGLMHVKSVC